MRPKYTFSDSVVAAIAAERDRHPDPRVQERTEDFERIAGREFRGLRFGEGAAAVCRQEGGFENERQAGLNRGG